MTTPKTALTMKTVRSRVTVVAGIALTATVILGLVIMYLLQRQSAQQNIDSHLRTYAQQIEQAGQGGSWPNPLPTDQLDPNAVAQVIAPDGQVLAATSSLQGKQAIYAADPGSKTPVRQKAADGVVPNELSVSATHATVAGHQVTIITATSTDPLSAVNELFSHLLIVGVPGILLLAAGTVWLVVGRALRPVEQIRRAVTEITAADLSQRVPEPGTQDEIGNLAGTMNAMLGRLDGAANRQRRFVADASHELRSPLAAIRTTLEVGLAHPDQAPWPEIAKRAVRQTERLEALIQQLLLLAKADDRQLAAQRKPVDLTALLADVLATTPAHQRDIQISGTQRAETTGDPEHLSRMFRNVLDNAIRYAEHTIQITVTANGTANTVEISDDGPGIPSDQRDRVFDRFVRLDASRERASGSSGLGLAIAKEIAIEHGGQISITDGPAGGAKVTITLPSM